MHTKRILARVCVACLVTTGKRYPAAHGEAPWPEQGGIQWSWSTLGPMTYSKGRFEVLSAQICGINRKE